MSDPVNAEKLRALRSRWDSSGMLDLAMSLARHMKDAWNRAGALEGVFEDQARDIDRVVVCGMGGSAIGADLAAGLAAGLVDVSIDVVRGYDVPAPLSRRALGIVSSYSGNTAETLSAFESLREGGAAVVAVTSGGELERRCSSLGIPCCLIPGGMPPRAAIAYSLIPILRILDFVGVLEFTLEDFERAHARVESLCRKYSLEEGGGEAVLLASRLQGKFPFIYACDGMVGAVARRWSCQFNENSKVLAHYALFPELCHNEIMGWEGSPGLRDDVSVIALEDEEDHPSVVKQMKITLDLISAEGADVTVFCSEGRGRLERLLSLLLLGDFASIYLALMNEVDPTPVEKIAELKRRMAEENR
jgi:glucose/mannose-6-phosphate isomerase